MNLTLLTVNVELKLLYLWDGLRCLIIGFQIEHMLVNAQYWLCWLRRSFTVHVAVAVAVATIALAVLRCFAVSCMESYPGFSDKFDELGILSAKVSHLMYSSCSLPWLTMWRCSQGTVPVRCDHKYRQAVRSEPHHCSVPYQLLPHGLCEVRIQGLVFLQEGW